MPSAEHPATAVTTVGDDRGLPRVAVGLGLRPATPADRIVAALGDLGRDFRIHCLATVDRRAADSGVRDAARTLAVPLHVFTAAALSRVEVPHPSERTSTAIGAPSVAEAAALLSGGGPLIVAKRVIDGVVIAAALVVDAPPPR
ncbi:cobalamin biosynthesis protein [Nocardia sp. NPDC005366]|uniref:cobalamin biosynthesis protein n=1 Tax=Nocardia sp. NPDC005366 TaxID=3156878 RepID=UPI0033B8A60B